MQLSFVDAMREPTMTELYTDHSGHRELVLCDTQPCCIAARLAAIGVRYRRLELPAVVFDAEAERDEVIGSYLDPLNDLLQDMPLATLDVTTILPSHPRIASLHRRFMTEHSHDGCEAQALVWGHGVLFMRAVAQVWALRCEAGDFVRLPPQMAHWFEFDVQTGFRTVRIYEERAEHRRIRLGRDMAEHHTTPRESTAQRLS